MFSRITFALALASLLAAGSYAQSQPARRLPGVVPLHKFRGGQWVEKVWGNPETPGEVSQSGFTMMRATATARREFGRTSSIRADVQVA
jgi:hypothetical protein